MENDEKSKVISLDTYHKFRQKIQSVLKIGIQGWGVSSTFAEMNTAGINELLEVFFPASPSSAPKNAQTPVVVDIGSGLGNFLFRAAILKGNLFFFSLISSFFCLRPSK